MLPLIRLLVFNRNPSLYSALRKLCETTADLQLIGEVADVKRLPAQCRIMRPHILVVLGEQRPLVFDLPALIQEVAPITRVSIT